MASVNVERTTQITKIYDKFYNIELSVDTNEYDIINSYFLKVMGSTEVARNFSASIFYIADKTGVEPLKYLENIKGQDQLQLSLTMSYYLNQFRSNSTLLGVGNVITPNFYAARNVII
jgi:hypothetical protein